MDIFYLFYGIIGVFVVLSSFLIIFQREKLARITSIFSFKKKVSKVSIEKTKKEVQNWRDGLVGSMLCTLLIFGSSWLVFTQLVNYILGSGLAAAFAVILLGYSLLSEDNKKLQSFTKVYLIILFVFVFLAASTGHISWTKYNPFAISGKSKQPVVEHKEIWRLDADPNKVYEIANVTAGPGEETAYIDLSRVDYLFEYAVSITSLEYRYYKETKWHKIDPNDRNFSPKRPLCLRESNGGSIYLDIVYFKDRESRAAYLRDVWDIII